MNPSAALPSFGPFKPFPALSSSAGPNLGGPNLGGPNLGGPNLGGPNLGGPHHGGPVSGGSRPDRRRRNGSRPDGRRSGCSASEAPGVTACGDFFELIHYIKDNSIDLILCDGPYGVTQNKWDKVGNIQEYNLNLLKIFSKKLVSGGSLYFFGKPDCIDFIDYRKYLNLKSKIVWYQPSRLAQGRVSWTNNYDIVCYFVKGARAKTFNLDAVRVSQLTETTHRKRCENVPSVKNGKWGLTRFNAKGKNPGDVWGDIKQLTYKSKELVSRDGLNTVQKPERLIERLVLASSHRGDIVLDPFCGTGTGPAVCLRSGRRFIGFEKDKTLARQTKKRLQNLQLSLIS